MAQGNDSPPRIDSHQHFWRYSVEEYGWIDDSMARLRRDFLPADLRGELDAVGLDGCIAVQARQTNAETDFLLELAEQNDWIRAVIGWVDLRSEDVAAELARIADHPRLAGVRHIVQAEPDGPHAEIYRDMAARTLAGLETGQVASTGPSIVFE